MEVGPSRLTLVVLVQRASAESNHPAETPFLLEVAAKTVRVPLTCGATCVPHEVMLPSTLTQVLRTGIIVTGGTEMGGKLGELVGVEEATDGSVLANAPAKLRPSTMIVVKRIAAIVVFFLIIVFILIIPSF